MAALDRRATAGGTWHAQVSLARTALWLRGLGRVTGGPGAPEPGEGDVAGVREESLSGFGTLSAIRHTARLAETPARYERPSMPLGSHPATWPPPTLRR